MEESDEEIEDKEGPQAEPEEEEEEMVIVFLAWDWCVLACFDCLVLGVHDILQLLFTSK